MKLFLTSCSIYFKNSEIIIHEYRNKRGQGWNHEQKGANLEFGTDPYDVKNQK